MSAFKLLCLSLVLVMSVFFVSNLNIARETESGNALLEIAEQYHAKRDYQQSMQWYLKAANEGNPIAMSRIGLIYQHGMGVERDYEQAMQWYLKASDKGDAYGMNNIGYLYEYGVGVKQDYQQALQWYLKAADNGHDGAMYNIGVFYFDGKGVKKDIDKASLWFQKAKDAQNKYTLSIEPS